MRYFREELWFSTSNSTIKLINRGCVSVFIGEKNEKRKKLYLLHFLRPLHHCCKCESPGFTESSQRRSRSKLNILHRQRTVYLSRPHRSPETIITACWCFYISSLHDSAVKHSSTGPTKFIPVRSGR